MGSRRTDLGGAPSRIEKLLADELRFSRSTYVPWGKEVIRALDEDDCLKLVEMFEGKAQLGAHVDVQVSANNYGGYIWTPWLHKFRGDTALHLALRQKKMKCAYMLLALGASTDIENHVEQTAGDVCLKVLQRGIGELRKEAFRQLVEAIEPSRYTAMPRVTPVNYRSIAQEAWSLVRDGRVVYAELPECLKYNDILPDPKKAPLARKQNWIIRYDAKSKRKYKYNEWTGEIIWFEEKQKGTAFGLADIEFKALVEEDKWRIMFDESGNRYYMNEKTGESTWEMPDAFKSKKSAKKKKEAAERAEESDYEIEEEDEKVQLEMLRKKRVLEEEAKIKAEQDRLAAIEEKARLAAEAEIMKKRAANNEWRKAQRDFDRLTGQSNQPGAWAVGDVWGRNGYTDTLRLIQRQRVRQDKEDEAQRHKESGLTLLGVANAGERPGISRELLKGLGDLKGYHRLKFLKMKELRDLAKEWEDNVDPRGDLELPIRYVTRLSTRTNLKGMSVGSEGFISIFQALVGDRIMQQIVLPGAGLAFAAVEELAKTLPTLKSIRVLDLSQNALCDDCARVLAEAILATPILVKLTVAANRISVDGATLLVEAVLDARCSLSYFSICNNHIRPAERERLIAAANPFHVSGQQVRFRQTKFIAPGGRRTVYPFTFTPFKKRPEDVPPVATAAAAAPAAEPQMPLDGGILSTSPNRKKAAADIELDRPSRGVTFGNQLEPTGLEESFDEFVYRGQGTQGTVGTPSFRGLQIYL